MTVTTESGATRLQDRALAPDLARGLMLLFIALANSHYFLQGSTVLGGYPQDGSGVDRAVTWLLSAFVDGRAFPMFGLLFGYGVARVVARQTGSVWATRRLLWRRAIALIGLGLLHAMLLYVGDILSAYGVLLLVGAFAIRWRDGWLLGVAALFLLLAAFPGEGSLVLSPAPPDASMLPTDPLTQVGDRLAVTWVIALLGPIGFMCPFLVGLWAGRRRILEQPDRHRLLLWIVAGVGLTVAVLGAQPVSLVLSGVVEQPDPDVVSILAPLHDAAGILGGLGYAALVALLALRLGTAPGPWVRALAATGQRSLTCYLAQSVVWSLVFNRYLLDLSATLTVATTAVLAVGTWLLTVVLADRMARAGWRGPFEVLLRRVTYGDRRRRVVSPSAA